MKKDPEEKTNCFHKQSGNLTGGFALITLGIIFVLNNLGVLPWSVWETLWKLWPIFLIVAGLEILINSCFVMQLTIFIIEIFILFYILFKPF